MDINKRQADHFQVGPFRSSADEPNTTTTPGAPIIPRAHATSNTVTIEMPRDMAIQLRALLGAVAIKPDGDEEVIIINRFPEGRGAQGYYGAQFTASQIHGLAVLTYNALNRQGV